MTFEEMKDRLTNIQNQSAQTKMLNSILICFAEIKNQQAALVGAQEKINEIIQKLNSIETAETVNNEIKEDKPQEDIIDKSTSSASSPIESEEK